VRGNLRGSCRKIDTIAKELWGGQKKENERIEGKREGRGGKKDGAYHREVRRSISFHNLLKKKVKGCGGVRTEEKRRGIPPVEYLWSGGFVIPGIPKKRSARSRDERKKNEEERER